MSEPGSINALPPFRMPDEDMVPFLRAMSPAQRLAKGLELHDLARRLVTSGVRTRHPDWDDAQVRAEVCRIMTADYDD
ncbi:MAG: hypothetical protein R3B68_13795 [Phycisphaerales bacterium]